MKTEVQVTHEKSEWAYAVYVIGDQGCIYSERFEYDADKLGSREKARADALKDYERSIGNFPGCSTYNDL
jgi:hypothetical protein